MPTSARATRPTPLRSLLGAALLLTASGTASALSVDAKALARFDVGYTRCEKLHPDMRGHRDEAYLSLWRTPAGGDALAALTQARQSADYRREQQRFRQAGAKPPSAGASGAVTIEQQCQALWSEKQRVAPPKTKPQPAPVK